MDSGCRTCSWSFLTTRGSTVSAAVGRWACPCLHLCGTQNLPSRRRLLPFDNWNIIVAVNCGGGGASGGDGIHAHPRVYAPPRSLRLDGGALRRRCARHPHAARHPARDNTNNPHAFFGVFFLDFDWAPSNAFRTPVMRGLMVDGIALGAHYSQSVCAPSRFSLNTGRHSAVSIVARMHPPSRHSARFCFDFWQLVQPVSNS